MPVAPRPKGKARKINYALLGEPANLKYKPSKKQREINKEILYQSTTRMK